MFVFGLLVGPAVGLIVGDFLLKSRKVNTGFGLAAAGLALAIVLLSSVIVIELRVGFVAGCLLGLLLSASPPSLTPTDEVVAAEGGTNAVAGQ